MSRPPANMAKFGSGFLGLDTRKSIILGLAGLLALITFLSLARTAPFIVSIGLPLFIALLGIAFSFGEINRQTVEEWLWTALAFKRNTRYYEHRHEDAPPDFKIKLAPHVEEKKVAAVKHPVYRDFFFLTANALTITVLVMLTLWYLQGGGSGLSRAFQTLMGGQ